MSREVQVLTEPALSVHSILTSPTKKQMGDSSKRLSSQGPEVPTCWADLLARGLPMGLLLGLLPRNCWVLYIPQIAVHCYFNVGTNNPVKQSKAYRGGLESISLEEALEHRWLSPLT